MGENLFDLAAKVSADTAGVDTNLTATQRKVLALAEEFKKLDAQAATSNKKIEGSELSLAKQMQAVESLQRQRSAALVSAFLQQERAAKQSETSTLAMRAAVRALGSEAASVAPGPLGAMGRQLSYVASTGGAVEGAFGGMLGPVALVAGAAVVMTGAAIGAGVAMYELASSAAESMNKLKTMHDETGLSVEMLQALGKAAQVTDVSMSSITAGIGIFEKKLTDASANGTSKLSAGLRTLGIDISSTDAAVNQMISLFGSLPDSVQRTGLAIDIFGRGGKQMLALIDEMKGNAQAYAAEMRRMGEIVGTDDVEAAREFTRQQANLGIQFDVLKDKIARSAFPVVEAWLKEISGWLVTNKDEIIAWGSAFARAADTAAAEVKLLAQAIYAIPNVWVTTWILKKVFSGDSSVPSAGLFPYGQGGVSQTSASIARQMAEDDADRASGVAAQVSAQQQAQKKLDDLAKLLAGGKEKHKRGGGKHHDPAISELAYEKEELKGLEQVFKAEEEAYDRSLKFREISLASFVAKSDELELARHAASEKILVQELLTAEKVKDAGKRKVDVQRALNALAAEHYKVTKKINDDEDKLREADIAKDKLYEEGKLAIYDVVAGQQKSRISELANWRVLTETQAGDRIGAIELGQLQKHLEYLQREEDKEKEGSVEWMRLHEEIGKTEAQISAQREKNEETHINNVQKDIDLSRQFLSLMRQMNAEAARSVLESQKAAIAQDIATGRRRRTLGDIISGRGAGEKDIARIEAEQETQRHLQALADLYARMDIELTKKTEEEKAKIREAYAKLIHAEDVSTAEKLREIQERNLVLINQRLQTVSSEIASVLSNSIRTGFEQGIKEGFRSMLIGFLQIIERMAEEWLASSIFKMLQGVFTPGAGTTGGVVSGGGGFLGFLKTILPFIGAAIGGGVGAGGGGGGTGGGAGGGVLPGLGGHFASGLDYVPYDNFPAILHRGERVVTASENRASSSGVTELHVHYHVESPMQIGSRETQRQTAEGLRRLQLKHALAG